ncbi:MAG: subfamily B ATP-binding cassette protein MsbA [Cellvibrionaceae bacterium]|jgi:subfamily B ATP-binding cassette protein MsbA
MPEQDYISSLTLYKRLLTYLKYHWVMFILGVAGLAVFAYSQMSLATVMGDLVDAINAKDKSARITIPLTLMIIFCYRGVGTFIGDYCFAKVAFGIVHVLRLELFNKLIVMPNRYFDENSSGEMMSRITFNTLQVTQAVTDAVKTIVREGLTVIVLMGYLFWINWQLTLIFIAVSPFIIFISIKISKRLRKLSSRIQGGMADISHACSEMINNFKVVRIFTAEEFEKDRFKKTSENSLKQNLKSVLTASIGTPILQLFAAIALALIMFLALTFFESGSAGTLITYLTAAGIIPRAVKQLANVMNNIQKGVAAADSIFQLLDDDSEADNGVYSVQRVNGQIQFNHIGFSYDDNKKVLDDFSVTVNAGETVAFVGRSGSGKTTLVGLLPRFYSGFSGEILLDDVSIDDYTLASLRSQISFVGQNVTLFNDTIENNIAYGNGSVSRDEVIEASKKASAWEFIKDLPDGIETMIGEDGTRLSGGQRQRLAIARALLKDAPILILDEATSALDNESERSIQAELETLMRGKTTLVVAHRLSTIEKADNIVVMDHGKIVEQGNHQALLDKKGYYFQLHSTDFEV